jgi:hypothetical protein
MAAMSAVNAGLEAVAPMIRGVLDRKPKHHSLVTRAGRGLGKVRWAGPCALDLDVFAAKPNCKCHPDLQEM